MLQPFVPFLDKERYHVICFFEIFLNKTSENKEISFSELQNKLRLSAYKLQEVFSAAQNICAQIPGLHLSYPQNNYVTLAGLDTLKLKKIILYEAHHSLRFKIFIHITLRPKGYSDAEFQQKHSISRATYFRLRALLLNDIGEDVNKHMHSSEAYSRYYIYNVIYYFCYLDFIDNDSGKKEITASINYITLLLKLSPTNIQRKQHLYFVAVSYWRNKIGYQMSDSDEKNFVVPKTTPVIQQMNAYFHKVWASSEVSASRITNFSLTFLLIIEELNTNMLPALRDYALVEKLTRQQIAVIRNSLGENFSQIDPTYITYKLLKINAKMLVPVYLDTFINKIKNWNFYEDSYVSIDQLTKQLLQCRINFKQARPVTKGEHSYLYRAYLFTIFSEIPATAFSDQVRIAVEFSHGIEYNDYIKKKLVVLFPLNIKIDKFVNSKTDIYLTNNFDPTFKNEQVVWDDPPLTKEFIQLRELIVKVKNTKHNANNNLSNDLKY